MKNERKRWNSRLFSELRRAEFKKLALAPWASQRGKRNGRAVQRQRHRALKNAVNFEVLRNLLMVAASYLAQLDWKEV